MENYEDGKYIVAHDVFGGLFASEKTIRYFSPDNLQWEDLGVNYEEFINWISEEDINDFYQPFLWEDANTLISEVKINEGIFIYPFLWTKECDLSTAFKKIVPFKDLLDNNFDSKSKLK